MLLVRKANITNVCSHCRAVSGNKGGSHFKVHHYWLSNRSNLARTHLKLYITFNHNCSVDDRREAVSVAGSLGREWIRRTETYLDKVGISV